MGNKDRANAPKRARAPVMPTVEEIVAEAREAKRARMANLVCVSDLASALGRHKSNIRRAAKKLGVGYALIDVDGVSYLTQDDATRIVERLA